jgi:hypothetical protein
MSFEASDAERNGFAIWSKRLERGRFPPSFSTECRIAAHAIEAAQLALILQGIDLAGARHRPRWEPSAKESYATLNP